MVGQEENKDDPDKEKIGIVDKICVPFEIKGNNDTDIILMDTEKVNFSAKELKCYGKHYIKYIY